MLAVDELQKPKQDDEKEYPELTLGFIETFALFLATPDATSSLVFLIKALWIFSSLLLLYAFSRACFRVSDNKDDGIINRREETITILFNRDTNTTTFPQKLNLKYLF